MKSPQNLNNTINIVIDIGRFKIVLIISDLVKYVFFSMNNLNVNFHLKKMRYFVQRFVYISY